jgi:hypothetical protein
MSPSELKLPKLHSWVYYIIDSIRSFSAVNRYTTAVMGFGLVQLVFLIGQFWTVQN